MTTIVTRPWDPAKYLTTPEDCAAYLEAALEDGDAAVIVVALGNIARAKGMSDVAREALSPDGNPEFATVLKVIRALGLRLTVA